VPDQPGFPDFQDDEHGPQRDIEGAGNARMIHMDLRMMPYYSLARKL